MSAIRLTKPQKTLTAIIECEGATIVGFRKGGNHLKVDYTFDHKQFFTQHLPNSQTLSQRWSANFRSAVRKTKPNLES